MLRFNKLRLSGFKSFVEGTELQIELGLTGIVGPNGCGKSNLVEGLRWVMGESSAKQMRGGERDDVIFGGTRDRPARNIAEVVLSLDNSARVAPAQFNDFEELEVSRRIERGKGSAYRVNGREARAREVQLLFADSATGARSTAIVSQGRIGAVIAAKPVERRLLLEEAAGITGLHSRRHEAELRLKGAETNLERLDDILVTLDTQLANLKKQVRQATRYRNLSDHIRKAEATLFFLRWTVDEKTLEAAEKEFAETEAVVATLTGAAGAAATVQVAHAAELPKRRQVEKLLADVDGDADNPNARQPGSLPVNVGDVLPIDAELVFAFAGGDLFMGQRIDVRVDPDGDVGVDAKRRRDTRKGFQFRHRFNVDLHDPGLNRGGHFRCRLADAGKNDLRRRHPGN